MKKCFPASLLLTVSICYSQSYHLELTNPEKNKTISVKEGDKVLMAVKMAKHQINKKPSDVYLLSNQDQADSVFVFTKGLITAITDSSIILKERNSIISADNREIRIDKVNILVKLTTGKQIFRTVTTVAGGLALGIAIFYSYAAAGGGEGFVSGMFYAAGTSALLTRFGRTKISKKNLNKWRIEVRRIISQPRW
jgi:hypothetical protein